MRSLVGASKLFAFFLGAMVTFAVQGSILIFTKGPVSLIYPRLFHRYACWIFGVKVIVEGALEEGDNIVYVGNHISYIDIQAVGSIIKGSFVAKKDVEKWPLFGALGKMGRTLYISRNPKDAAEEINLISNRLKENSPVIIFGEGTSSNGTSILPFKSSFFEIFLNQKIRIQPFTISILEIHEETPISDNKRDYYAWYGDMSFEPHLWRFAKGKGAIVKIILQKSIVSTSYKDRKLLSNAVYVEVSKGLDLSLSSQ